MEARTCQGGTGRRDKVWRYITLREKAWGPLWSVVGVCCDNFKILRITGRVGVWRISYRQILGHQPVAERRTERPSWDDKWDDTEWQALTEEELRAIYNWSSSVGFRWILLNVPFRSTTIKYSENPERRLVTWDVLCSRNRLQAL